MRATTETRSRLLTYEVTILNFDDYLRPLWCICFGWELKYAVIVTTPRILGGFEDGSYAGSARHLFGENRSHLRYLLLILRFFTRKKKTKKRLKSAYIWVVS